MCAGFLRIEGSALYQRSITRKVTDRGVNLRER
jgi:hypothetical protein